MARCTTTDYDDEAGGYQNKNQHIHPPPRPPAGQYYIAAARTMLALGVLPIIITYNIQLVKRCDQKLTVPSSPSRWWGVSVVMYLCTVGNHKPGNVICKLNYFARPFPIACGAKHRNCHPRSTNNSYIQRWPHLYFNEIKTAGSFGGANVLRVRAFIFMCLKSLNGTGMEKTTRSSNEPRWE